MTAAATHLTPTHGARMVFPIQSEDATLAELRDEARADFLAALRRVGAVPAGRTSVTFQHGAQPTVTVAGQAWAPRLGAVELT